MNKDTQVFFLNILSEVINIFLLKVFYDSIVQPRPNSSRFWHTEHHEEERSMTNDTKKMELGLENGSAKESRVGMPKDMSLPIEITQ